VSWVFILAIDSGSVFTKQLTYTLLSFVYIVIPAKAGIQVEKTNLLNDFATWIPAFAGMTMFSLASVIF